MSRDCISPFNFVDPLDIIPGLAPISNHAPGACSDPHLEAGIDMGDCL
jgi:hypothetical protein